MLFNAIKKTKIPNIIKYQLRAVHFKEFKYTSELKYDPAKDPSDENMKNFEKEYFPTHWVYQYLPGFKAFFGAADNLKIIDTDKDNELGRFKWNSNGCYPNRLANIFYRSRM